MCLYCKKLKEINTLHEKELIRTINSWKRRDFFARELVKNLVQLHVFNLPTQRRLIEEADEFVKCNYVGK